MSDLLSASESHEIHSFLSSIDYMVPNDSRSISNTEWHGYSNEGMPIPQPPHGKGKEALTKATKDLMSLDSSYWGASSSHESHIFDSHPSNLPQYGFETPQNTSHDSPHHPQHSQHRTSISTSVTFPFLSNSKQRSFHPSSSSQSRLDSSGPMGQSLDQTHPSVAPIHTTTGVNHPNHSGIHTKSANSPIGTSPSSASSFSSHNSGAGASNSTLSSLPTSEASGASESTNCNNKRTLDASSQSSTSKRQRASPPSTSGMISKSSLLSPSQKKANHIQSEQKRRANIRRGYEALCETVPALKEAIKQEELQQMNGVNGSKGSMKARRGRGRGQVDEGTGEKIDGRAGPRSENIVLSKTIEYINELLKDRETLLGRLNHVKLSLGPNHPSHLTSNSVSPLWERVWTGGSGKDADAEDEDEEDGDE